MRYVQELLLLFLVQHSGSQTLIDSRLMSLQQEVEELKNQQQFRYNNINTKLVQSFVTNYLI